MSLKVERFFKIQVTFSTVHNVKFELKVVMHVVWTGPGRRWKSAAKDAKKKKVRNRNELDVDSVSRRSIER